MYRPQAGVVRKRLCPTCRGSGQVFKNDSIYQWGWRTCPSCNGKGQIEFAGPADLPPMRPGPQRNALKKRPLNTF